MVYPYAESYGGEGIFLNSNVNPFGPPDKAIEAIKENIMKVNLYSRYYDSVKRKIVEKLSKEGIDIEEKNIVLGNGSDEVIEFVFKFAMRKLGRDLKIIVGEGTFAFYEFCARYLGLGVVKVPLSNFGYDLEELLRTLKRERPAVLCLSHPINPTGKIIPKDDYKSFLDMIPDGVFVISDEAYFEFSFSLNGKDWRGDDYRSALHIKRSDSVFVTRTFSKVYGLAGLRLGYLISNFSDEIEKEFKPPFNVNCLAIVAAEGALDDKEYVEKTLRNNLEGIRFLEENFKRIGVFFVPSWANFVLVQDKQKKRYSELIKNKVFVRDMAQYGYPEFIRVSVGKINELYIFMSIFENQKGEDFSD